MKAPDHVNSPQDDSLRQLCQRLAELSNEDQWPGTQLALCGNYGVFEWFLPSPWGQQWNEPEIVRGYLELSRACLTTTFVITQRTGACKRLAASANEWLKQELLPGLASGATFATVAISHLTTSRRHLGKPILTARRQGARGDCYLLDGFSPWVTGADHADYVVTGAVVAEEADALERELLVAIPTDLPGVSCPPRHELVGLSGSHTGPLKLDQVRIEPDWIVSGPEADIMGRGTGASTGGLQTSTLAVGLASAAVDFLQEESHRRDELLEPAESLSQELGTVRGDLLQMAAGQTVCSKEDLRTRANSLVLRATQAALTAAKGTGYVAGHPVGRWCREALFFLVWSCPQPVLAANLCELAGIAD